MDSEEKQVNDMIYLGRLLPTNSDKIHQNQEVYSVDGIACCLKSTNYKDPPKILEITDETHEIK